jgi:signal transduction histidine kinase
LSETATRLGEGDFDAQSSLVGIKEIDSVSRSMNEMATRLGSTVKRERAFSSNVSHQLRTPLTALRVTIEAALDEPTGDARGALRDGLTAVDRLQTTVTDMLMLSRDGRHASRPLDVAKLLAEVRDRWSPYFRSAGRTLQIDNRDVQAAASMSDVAARQILNVLVENAAQHGHGTVTIRIRDAESTVAIDVSQDGPSLDRNAQLFVRDANRPRGRGIGLSLARGLAESEGSRLNLTNTDPPTFTLMIPRINER